MTTNDQAHLTAQKQFYKQTTHKSDFSFSSPQQEAQTVIKRALMQSSRIDVLRNRVELFADMKQNSSILTLINKSYPKQFVEQMRTQQRVQIEKLLLEISRLHDMLEDQEKMHRHAIQRLKQESEQIALLRISNLKQSQYSQIQVIEIQLRKTKEALQQKTLKLEDLQRMTSRKIENLANENQRLKADIKELLEKKNMQLYELRSKINQQTQQSTRRQSEALDQLKSLADKELKKVMSKLEQRQRKIADLTNQSQTTSNQITKLQKIMEAQRKQLDDKLEQVIEQQRQRQQIMTNNLKQFYQRQLEETQNSQKLERELFKSQLQNLIKIIQIKDEEARKLFVFRETEKIDYKLQINTVSQENQYLKQVIETLKKQNLEDIQLLKVKMGVLHKSDLQALVRVYEAKLQSLAKDIEYADNQSERLTKQLKKERDTTYQMKKKYDYTISFLHQEIWELKVGAGNHEKQMKQKMDNDKSMMMLTSRNFIKQNEAKANNIRFYEEQLRKLRQLLQIQAQQVEQSERNVEEKIKLAEEQLSRLSNKIIEVKTEAEQSQKKLKHTIEQKNKQIKRLNNILNCPVSTQKKDDNLAQQLKKMDEELSKKQDQIRTLKNRCEDLESTLRTLRAQNQKLIIQNQINSEDAKKKYKAISDKNLADMKAFYDRRLQELQNDKRQLERINSSQSEQITQLIKRYKDLEEGMKQLIKQSKKRGDLETRIISLGMDNNLVKNMSELFHK